VRRGAGGGAQPLERHYLVAAQRGALVSGRGLLWKVIVPMFLSPLLGFVGGFVLMALLYVTLRTSAPPRINAFFGKAQMFSAGAMGVMHGTNDAQKTMGIIALALLSATKAGTFDHLPAGWSSSRSPAPAGEGFGNRDVDQSRVRVDHGLGHGRGRLAHHQDAGAQNGQAASDQRLCRGSQFGHRHWAGVLLGIPVSTTHNIAASIMGVGCAKRFNAIKWTVVERMVWAWVLTLPATGAMGYALVQVRLSGAMGYALVRLSQTCGWTKLYWRSRSCLGFLFGAPISQAQELPNFSAFVAIFLGFGRSIVGLAEGMFGIADSFLNQVQRLCHTQSFIPRRRCRCIAAPRTAMLLLKQRRSRRCMVRAAWTATRANRPDFHSLSTFVLTKVKLNCATFFQFQGIPDAGFRLPPVSRPV
jgi:hypothetical protein